jgi:hypothetical protein
MHLRAAYTPYGMSPAILQICAVQDTLKNLRAERRFLLKLCFFVEERFKIMKSDLLGLYNLFRTAHK